MFSAVPKAEELLLVSLLKVLVTHICPNFDHINVCLCLAGAIL